VSPPDTRQDVEDLHEHHMHAFGETDPDAATVEESGSCIARRIPERPAVIEHRRITLEQAEELLSTFRLKSPHFPFIQIADDATVPSLSRTSPFLLLAILTTASIRDPPLYHQMDFEFKRILSTKVIVEGRKSLDYVQGILVYLAW
jgi:hypothetical protein